MIKGGYKIIDLKETSFTSGVAMVIDGIYDSIESTNKATLLSGLVLGGVEYDDLFVTFNVVESSFKTIITLATASGTATITILVQDTDVVTVTLA